MMHMKAYYFLRLKILILVVIVLCCLSVATVGSKTSGYWKLVDVKTTKVIETRPASEIVVNQLSITEGSMSRTLTTDNHGGEGPATWAGDCTWTWNATHGLDNLVPGDIIEASITVTDRSVPEKVSGWQHGYTGVASNIRIDRPYMPPGTVDGAATDIVNLSVGYLKTGSQEGKVTVPEGPGWDGKISIAASCSIMGRFERVYEWVPGGIPPKTPVPPPQPTPPPKPDKNCLICQEALTQFGPSMVALKSKKKTLDPNMPTQLVRCYDTLEKDFMNALKRYTSWSHKSAFKSDNYAGTLPALSWLYTEGGAFEAVTKEFVFNKDKIQPKTPKPGTEAALYESMNKMFKDTGKKLTPDDVMFLALKERRGDMKDALLLAHNTMRSLARSGDAGYTGVIPEPEFFDKVLVPIRTGENAGPWYHMFGTAYFEMETRGEYGPSRALDFINNYYYGGKKILFPVVNKALGRKGSNEPVYSLISDLINSAEQFIREEKTNQDPDPEKYCINAWGAKIGTKLYTELPYEVETNQPPQQPYQPPLASPLHKTESGELEDTGHHKIGVCPVNFIWEGQGQKMVLDQKAASITGYYPVALTPVYEQSSKTWGALWTDLTDKPYKLTIQAVGTGSLHLGIADRKTGKILVYAAAVKPGQEFSIMVDNNKPKIPLSIKGGGEINPVTIDWLSKPSQTDTLGNKWIINEIGKYFGTWTRRKGTNTFDAEWNNGSIRDTIDIESVNGDQVVLYRHGNNGRYYGTIAPDGKSIQGTASWYEKGWSWSATIKY
jgi:hypothetical protein